MKIDHRRRLEESINYRTKVFEEQYGDIPMYKRSWERLLTDLYWEEHRQTYLDELGDCPWLDQTHNHWVGKYIEYIKREGIPKKYCGLKHFIYFINFKMKGSE